MVTCTNCGSMDSLSVYGTSCRPALAVVHQLKGMNVERSCSKIFSILLYFIYDIGLKRPRMNRHSVSMDKAMPSWPKYRATILVNTVSLSVSSHLMKTPCFS